MRSPITGTRRRDSFGAEHFAFRQEGREDVKAEQRRQEGKGEKQEDAGVPMTWKASGFTDS